MAEPDTVTEAQQKMHSANYTPTTPIHPPWAGVKQSVAARQYSYSLWDVLCNTVCHRMGVCGINHVVAVWVVANPPVHTPAPHASPAL